MSTFRKSTPPTHGSRRPASRPQPSTPAPAPSNFDLFPIAVFIMGIVSCYTTAVGLYPMLGNWVLSYATAFALSTFMVAIALRIPKAYEEGNHLKLIAGYIFVALFSVLLNFNAIFGVFSSEKLLYEELKNAKQELTAIGVSARESLDEHFGAIKTQRKLDEARAMLKEETVNRVDPGYGQNARRINQERVIPLQAELASIRAKYDPVVQKIDTLVSSSVDRIDQALATEDIATYRRAVDHSVDAYNQVGILTQNLIGRENFSYQPLTFEHRDVGNLNHSLWTVMNLPQLSGKQASSVIVSLLLSFLIDFIVLFVLVMINRPGQGDLNAPAKGEEESPSAEEPAQGRQSFGHGQTEAERERRSTIYARRSERRRDEQGEQLNRHQVNRQGNIEPPIHLPTEDPTEEVSATEAPTEQKALPAPKSTETSDPTDEPPVWPQAETQDLPYAETESTTESTDAFDGNPPQWEVPTEVPYTDQEPVSLKREEQDPSSEAESVPSETQAEDTESPAETEEKYPPQAETDDSADDAEAAQGDETKQEEPAPRPEPRKPFSIPFRVQ